MKPTIYIHHDAYPGEERHLDRVNAQHKAEGYPRSTLGYYTFYQFFIERDGTGIQTRPFLDPSVEYKPAHRNSISVCLAGNFDAMSPKAAQIETLISLFTILKKNYDIGPWEVKEHRDYQNTSCPGLLVPRGYFRLIFIASQYTGVRAVLYGLLTRLGMPFSF